MTEYVLFFLTSLGWGLILIALLRRLALKRNLVTAQGVTYVGGPGMWIVFSLVCILGLRFYGPIAKVIWGLILGSALIIAFGVIDDYKKELSVFSKLLAQLLATFILILFGVRTQIVYIGPYLNLLITFLWVLGITNAFNHLDILDGLAGGVAALCSGTLFFIALFNTDFSAAIAALVLTAAILSFLRYNLSSAKVYMGNSGSHFLGFSLAAIAIAISYAPLERKTALISPIVILGIPIYDTLFLVLRRAKKGRSLFRKSDDHFTLRLLARGYSQKRVLTFMYLLGLLFSLSGLLISVVSNQISVIVLLVLCTICFIIGKKHLFK